MIKDKFLRKDNCNIHYLNRYCKLIDVFKNKRFEGDVENHHIFPKSIFRNDTVIAVPTKWHYILHWILYKIFTNERYKAKCIFAFNMMSRALDKKKGVLYEIKRKQISSYISRMNSGRKLTEEQKDKIAMRFIGKIVVKDKNGKYYHVSADDERYVNGELVFYRCGYVHKESTIQKMILNNGVRGKTIYHNEKTGIARYFFEGEEPEGYVKGAPIKTKVRNHLSTKGRKWYNNGITNKRFKDGEEIPEGYVIGRLRVGNFCGFDNVNASNKVKGNPLLNKKGYKSMVTGKIRYFSNNEVIPDEYIKN